MELAKMASEKRLIDANWILGKIEHDIGCYELENVIIEDGLYVELRDVVRMVCAAPTLDAVEVVRCKDCIYRHTRYACQGRSMDFYCASGKRVGNMEVK